MSQHQALNQRPTKTYGSTDTRVEMKESESDNEHVSQPKFKIKLNEVRSMNDFCQWLTTDTLSKLHIIFFFVAIIVPFIIAFYYFIMHEYSTSYVVSGIWGIATSLYGLNHFRTLFDLKNEIDSYQTLNNQFKNERKGINKEIKKLSKASNSLKDTHTSLRNSNLRMVDMIKKFDLLEDQLEALNMSNNEKLSDIGDKADKLRGKYYDISLQQQRSLLWKLFDRLEARGANKKGITEQDYDIFYDLLPNEYKQRFKRLGGFNALVKLSTTPHKHYITAKDFERALSVYARMHVENVDLVFKLNPMQAKTSRKSSKKSGLESQPSFLKGITIIKKKKQKGFYLSKEAIWAAASRQDEHEGKSSHSATPEHDYVPTFGRQKRINS